jgi:phosphotransferase system enzyme I (PtsI)
MSDILGTAVSGGIEIAKAFVFSKMNLQAEISMISDPEAEWNLFLNAVSEAEKDLKLIKAKAQNELGENHAKIFNAQLLILDDPDFTNPVKDMIYDQLVGSEYALSEVSAQLISLFENMSDSYMRERAADVRDLSLRVLAKLNRNDIPELTEIHEAVILVAEELTPSDTMQLDRKFIRGFVTDTGGPTSHSAIIARSLGIPAVVGTKVATKKIEHGATVIIDGFAGKLIIDPSKQTVEQYLVKKRDYEEKKDKWSKLVDEPTTTRDSHSVELAANIASVDDLQAVIENGAEGIGLFRTEFLYMGKEQLPTEDEQYEVYKTVLQGMNGKPVVVRTLDIGGDKELPTLGLPAEANPFLGVRAIRLCLQHEELFRTQLRALLRAGSHGNLKIMFPMISTVTEVVEAKALLREVKEELLAQGVPVTDPTEIGIMIEVPSAALIAEHLAEEVDFFSIGSNDLVQYTMAADRMNERISYLYQPFHPAVLQLIHIVIQAAHRKGKWVGMCGEMASDPNAIPILLGFGLDEFSMSASSILPTRSLIRQLSKEEAEKYNARVLKMSTSEEVLAFAAEHFRGSES